ncbi:S8 family serine peptidase [Negadavirga shengliensis]|uniref:S8 family serine peptidase n=1 Tax=Negadavirga shengliensis TaxID=1389218 RepID=A0ABV9T722_9BACT
MIFLAAIFTGLSSCQPDVFEETEKEDQSVETTVSGLLEGHYIVVLKRDAVNARIQLHGDHKQRTEDMKSAIGPLLRKALIAEASLEHVYSSSIYGFSAPLNKDMLDNLIKDPEVAYIEQDRIITLAPPWERGEEDAGTGQEAPYGINRVGGAVDFSDCNHVAWVIDTGIDLDHPDLNVDESRGFNAFTKGRDSKSLDDGDGHGTHVAGIIGAIDNEIGVVGVAAGVTVVPIKVLDSKGNGTYSGVIAGVDYVAANGEPGDVANLSLGGPESATLDQAVVEAAKNGVIFCVAAGNDADDADNYSPARAEGKNVYTISAMDNNDTWASFSNFGNPPVDFCSPGVSIRSTWKGGAYRTISGTSMAAPHAAGVFLVSGGNYKTDGVVKNDPDGFDDPVIVHK